MKAQIFSLDAMLAIVALTVIVGYFSWSLENTLHSADISEYESLQRMADDWAQLAVKRILAQRDEPNKVDSSRLSDLAAQMSELLVSPYDFELHLGNSKLGGDCSSKQNVVSVRRLVYDKDSAEGKVFELRLCV
ncbi:hypothetical protein DRN74_01685 [Candidatus Micrarchaeota archaeon]|nr:MAG: hypothetical protein DRN74_01685 [Candidatus Micrarchaeota archaeon]